MRVYADNAATTKLSAAAKEAMLPYFDEIYGNPSTLYTLGQEAAEHLLACRTEIAQLIGAADPREIVFTSGGSEADNQAIVSAAVNGARKGKKHLISTKFEHHAVLHTLDKLRRQGFEVTLLDVHEDGVVRVEDVAAAIRDDTALVSVMFANNEIGTLQPIEAIGALCRERGVPFHTDAVQAIGHVPVNVQEMNIDMLSCSAHKFHGPRGVGFLYARRGIPLTNIIEGGAQERGKRGGTENTPAIAGMTAALREAVDHMDEQKQILLLIMLHMLVDFDLQFAAIGLLGLLCLDYGKAEGSLKKKTKIEDCIFLTVISVGCIYFCIPFLLDYVGEHQKALSFYGAYTPAQLAVMEGSRSAEEATSAAEQILTHNTHLAEVYQYLAYGALEKENYEESFINMEKAISCDIYAKELYDEYEEILSQAEKVQGSDQSERRAWIRNKKQEVLKKSSSLAYELNERPQL